MDAVIHARTQNGEGASLTLARIYIMNEIIAQTEYLGKSLPLNYFKSQRGRPSDLVWENTPIRIIASYGRSSGCESEPRGDEEAGIPARTACAPADKVDIPKKGIGIAPCGLLELTQRKLPAVFPKNTFGAPVTGFDPRTSSAPG